MLPNLLFIDQLKFWTADKTGQYTNIFSWKCEDNEGALKRAWGWWEYLAMEPRQ